MNAEEIDKRLLEPNFVDKFAAYFPKWARGRAEERFKMSLVGGYGAAAKVGAVFENFITGVTDADSSVDWGQRLTIVERVRQLVRDSPVANAIIGRTCDHSIGSRGLTLHPQIDFKRLGWSPERAIQWQDEADSLWRLWSESPESDISRIQNFQEKQYLTLKSSLEGGDCFTLFTEKTRAGSDFKLKLQTLESERCNNKDYAEDTINLVEGVVKNNAGAPEQYQFSNIIPNDFSKTTDIKWDELNIFDPETGRRNILQHYTQIRPGQTRGIPLLAPVIDKILQLNRLSNAELLASVINSFYTIVIKGDPANTKQTRKSPSDTGSVTANDKLKLGHGSIVRADEGTEFESFDPKRPNHLFEPFFNAEVAQIGASVGIPKSLILMWFDKSYSASRGEVLLAWVYFLTKRTNIAVGLCQPSYEAFLDEVISRNILEAPGYFSDFIVRKAFQGSAYNQWTGPTRPAIDEFKEAQANALANAKGWKSLTGITTETTGKDWIKVTEQIAREHKLRVKAGIETEVDIPGIGGA